MKKLLTLLLLATLLLTACASPNPPLGNETTEAPTDAESTTPDDTELTTVPNETTTPEDIETTTPQESESDTTEQNPPEELLTEFPEIPIHTPYCWTKRTLENYLNVPLSELTPLYRNEKAVYLGKPFEEDNHTYPTLYVIQKHGIPIENITLTDDTHLCVVYKIVHESTEQEIYFYQMFELTSYWSGSGINRFMYESTSRSKEGYWGTTLQYSDFSDLKVGDSLEKAQSIAPQIGFTLDFVYESIPMRNYLLLEDGVLIVDLAASSEDAYSIGQMQFYPYGTAAELYGRNLSVLTATNRPPLPGEDD